MNWIVTQKKTIGFIASLLSLGLGMFITLSDTPSHNESQTDKTVSIYLWAESVPVDIYQKFTRETGIKVVYNSFDSNEMLYTKIKTQGIKKFDVDIIMPSTYFVEKMAKEDLLLPLDKRKLTQFAQLNPALLNKAYDPNNTYSLPHIIGATGIGINTARITTPVTSWEQLWEPRFKDALILIDDAREVFHIALLTLGYPTSTQDPQHIEAAYQKLLALIPNIKAFNSDNPSEPFLTGDINIGMLWSGSALSAKAEDANIHMVYPDEGAIFWVDNFAIPKYARNPNAAHLLIDFLCRPENAAEISLLSGYRTPVLASYAYLPQSFRDDPAFIPSETDIAKGDFQTDVGDAGALYEHYYQKLKIAASAYR